jgi:broad specificity phosphatase PhoE
MKFKLLFCGLLALAIPAATFAEPSQDGDSNALKNAVILIIRHAEQPAEGNGLSAAGEARAKAYVNYFKNFKVDGQPLKLDQLFAAKDSSSSHRPGLTIEPLAQDLGLKIDSRFKNNQFSQLIDDIQNQPHGTNILICWHHGNIPQLLRALGADPNTLLHKGKWPNNVYDWLIQLRYDENGHLLESKRINENLSFDDSGNHTLPAA